MLPGRPRRTWSVAKQLLVLQAVLMAVLVASGALLVYLDESGNQERAATDTVTALAVELAGRPDVQAGFTLANPAGALQPLAERVRAETHVDFITIMNTDGVRYSHPNPQQIGQHYLGNTEQARAGRVFSETYTGTLGRSVRTVAPVFDAERTEIGMISVGITVQAIGARLQQRLSLLVGTALLVLGVGMTGTCLVTARLGRHTRGVSPGDLSRMFDYYESTLHAFREGLLLIDREGRITLCNNAARELLGIGEESPATVSGLKVPEEFSAAMTDGRTRTDEVHVTGQRILVINTSPVCSRGDAMGTVVTLRDRTELLELTDELNSARRIADALRAYAHEAANRLHTVVSLVELGRPEQAVEFATTDITTAQELADRILEAMAEPVLAALLLGKSAEAHERGVALAISEDTEWDGHCTVEPGDLVTVLGNLIDNAVDAASANAGSSTRKPTVTVTVRASGEELMIRVADTGAGVDPESLPQLSYRGWSTKTVSRAGGRGLGLALIGQVVLRYRGHIEVARDDGAVFTVRLPLRRCLDD